MKTDETFVGEKRVEPKRVAMERVTGRDGGGRERRKGNMGRREGMEWDRRIRVKWNRSEAARRR